MGSAPGCHPHCWLLMGSDDVLADGRIQRLLEFTATSVSRVLQYAVVDDDDDHEDEDEDDDDDDDDGHNHHHHHHNHAQPAPSPPPHHLHQIIIHCRVGAEACSYQWFTLQSTALKSRTTRLSGSKDIGVHLRGLRS